MSRSTIAAFIFATVCGALALAETVGEDVAPLNATDCEGVSFEGDVDCSNAVELVTELMTNGTECNGTSFAHVVDCTMIGSVDHADGEGANAEISLTPIPDSSLEDDDLLMDVTAFELYFRPPWAGALSRTLMGWNAGIPTQLTSHVPGDGSSTSDPNLLNLCENEIGGEYLNSVTQGYCFVREEWTQLVSGVPGMQGLFPSMESTCLELGGHPLGSNKQYCALKGAWTQLYERVPGASSWHGGLRGACSAIRGTYFSGLNSNFCFVKGYYSQFSTKMPGDASWTSNFDPYLCDDMGGYRFGTMCIVEGVWAQLTTKLPFDSSWPAYFPSYVCDDVGGKTFGEKFCAVKGTYAQLSTKMVGDSSWTSRFPSYDCDTLGGSTFSDRYCLVSGPHTQLSTRLPDDNSWLSKFPSSTCDEYGGLTFADRYCAAKGEIAQFSTRYPGVSSNLANFPTSICDEMQGSTFASRYCGARGKGSSPTSGAAKMLGGRLFLVPFALSVASGWLL